MRRTGASHIGKPVVPPLQTNAPRPAGWVDGWHEDGFAGWLYWPSPLPAPTAVLNGCETHMVLEVGARPDVQRALHLSEAPHQFRVAGDVLGMSLERTLSLKVVAGREQLDILKGSTGLLLRKAAEGRMADWVLSRLRYDPELQHAFDVRLSPAMLNGAVVDAANVPPRTGPFFEGRSQVGNRPDFHVSRYQHFAYYRHAREHPGYPTGRHFTLATHAGLLEFLVWSCRSYSGNYPLSPLPVGEADLRVLNASVPNTGLRMTGVLGHSVSLPLTQAQVAFLRKRFEAQELIASDEDQYAGWLLAWLGSWGWGHRGAVSLTRQQRAFLVGQPSAKPSTVGELVRYNPFVAARLREHDELLRCYPDQHLVDVRLATLGNCLLESASPRVPRPCCQSPWALSGHCNESRSPTV